MASSAAAPPRDRREIVALLLLLLISLSPIAVVHVSLRRGATPRVQRSAAAPLRFRRDGAFKVLQVADMHYGMGGITSCRDVAQRRRWCSDRNTTAFLARVIHAERPDLVVFTGDNIFGPSTVDAAESLFQAFGPVMELELPWAAILGNHDHESTMTKEELMTLISLMDYSVSQANPSDNYGKIDGFGNYNIKIYGPFGSGLANTSIFNLYFLDSGDRTKVNGYKTYDWIKESQLLWLRQISKELQSVFLAPAVAFFHIPIPEVRSIALKGVTGQYQEAVACSLVNSGVLSSFVSMGDVKAAFFGHDHLNDFCSEADGLHLCYGGGFGYHAYGRVGWPRRARVILAELDRGDASWNGVEKISTWKRLDDASLTLIDEQVLWERRPESLAV